MTTCREHTQWYRIMKHMPVLYWCIKIHCLTSSIEKDDTSQDKKKSHTALSGHVSSCTTHTKPKCHSVEHSAAHLCVGEGPVFTVLLTQFRAAQPKWCTFVLALCPCKRQTQKCHTTGLRPVLICSVLASFYVQYSQVGGIHAEILYSTRWLDYPWVALQSRHRLFRVRV